MANERKFCSIDQHLRIALGVEIPNKLSNRRERLCTFKDIPGVAEVYPFAGRDSYKVYFDLSPAQMRPEKIQVVVPEILKKALWGELLFSDMKNGAQVLFARDGEAKPFGPEGGKYVILRLYRRKDYPFNPVFVRVDKGSETYFFKLNACWQNGTISVEVVRNPDASSIPPFLVKLDN